MKRRTERQIKEKFEQERTPEPIKAMNEIQKLYIKYLREKDVILATGYAGTSKAQPLSSKVLTPKGWVTMGDIQVGDYIVTPKNKPSRVLEVHNFKDKKVVEIEFASGRKVECCEDHLWKVYHKKKKGLKSEVSVLPTKYMIENFNQGFSIPYSDAVGEKKDKELPIDPYILGLLLAEGYLDSKIQISTGDKFIVDKLNLFAEENGLYLKKVSEYDYIFQMKDSIKGNQISGIVHPLKRKLELLELLGTRSHTKFIPKQYLEGSIDQRWELLRGLMDGDGNSPIPRKKGNHKYLSTSSEQLSNDFKALALSLGCSASIKQHMGSYKVEGVIKETRPNYQVTVNHREPKKLFSLPRKIENCSEIYQGGKYPMMDKIKSIKQVRVEDVRCILIDDDEHLYLTDNYVVTHNTFIPTSIACDEYRQGRTNKIYLIRPNISNSKSLGYFSGSLEDKMAQWLSPVLNIMHDRMGKGATDVAIKNGNIQFVPLEVIKGHSFENSWVIIDEAEDMTAEEAKKVVTRIGKKTKMVLAGDISQSELKQNSGLSRLIKLAEDNPQLENHVGIVDFNRPSDIVRSDICREFILAFTREE